MIKKLLPSNKILKYIFLITILLLLIALISLMCLTIPKVHYNSPYEFNYKDEYNVKQKLFIIVLKSGEFQHHYDTISDTPGSTSTYIIKGNIMYYAESYHSYIISSVALKINRISGDGVVYINYGILAGIVIASFLIAALLTLLLLLRFKEDLFLKILAVYDNAKLKKLNKPPKPPTPHKPTKAQRIAELERQVSELTTTSKIE